MRQKYLTATVLILAMMTASLTSCGDAGRTPQGGQTSTAPPPTPKIGFEKDLDYVRKGQYTYIWVFSRKDGKPIDKEDAAYLRTNAPQVVDWVTTDEGKKVIAGTNFDLALGNLELLQKRFIAEDYTAK